jgi:hypothetical protein
MPGLKREARLRADVPGIHAFLGYEVKTWMAGTRLRQGFAGLSRVSPPKL